MTWKYTPKPVKNETYWFTGPFYVSNEIEQHISSEDLTKAFRAVIEASIKHGGLDKIQELEHETSKAVILIINLLSQEQKQHIRRTSATAEEDIKDQVGTFALLQKK